MNATVHYIHRGIRWGQASSAPYRCGALGQAASTNKSDVTCPDCRRLIAEPAVNEQLRRAWTVACVGGDTELGFAEWMREVGVGPSTPKLLRPPRMEDERGLTDGVFIFYDVDYQHPDERLRNEYELEVVPQTTGNVEITCAGTLFTLSHLDRMDLVRALLHDFHYSPEKDGPTDDA